MADFTIPIEFNAEMTGYFENPPHLAGFPQIPFTFPEGTTVIVPQGETMQITVRLTTNNGEGDQAEFCDPPDVYWTIDGVHAVRRIDEIGDPVFGEGTGRTEFTISVENDVNINEFLNRNHTFGFALAVKYLDRYFTTRDPTIVTEGLS